MRIQLFILLLVFVSLVSAQTFPQPVDSYVNDFASVLTIEDQALLQSFFTTVFENTSVQVVFVSMSTIGDEAIDSYTVSLGETWGVGDAEKDRGVVILYVLDQNKIFVATGYGVEGILPDSKLGRLLDQYYVPLRNLGNVSEGIVVFSAALSDEIIQNADELQSPRTDISSFWIVVVLIVVVIILIIVFVSYSKQISKSRWIPIFIPSGGSSSGGFGGFGGGSFGGGGAGR